MVFMVFHEINRNSAPGAKNPPAGVRDFCGPDIQEVNFPGACALAALNCVIILTVKRFFPARPPV